MSNDVSQSAIKEVRDQLMIDTADGEYLNSVTSNLGLHRPSFGLSDDEWRAIGKILGLSYKQIRTKFEAILSVLYGPKITQVSSLSTTATAGDSIIYLHSTYGMPQIGTIILDENLSNEEEITYSFIDRRTNAVYLDSSLTYAHVSTLKDYEKPLLVSTAVSDTSLILPNVDGFPTSFPFTVVVGRGSENEEVVTVSAKDSTGKCITVSAMQNAHVAATPGSVFSTVSSDYVSSSYILALNDINKFPEEGEILFSEPPKYTALSGTTTTVTIGGGSLVPNTIQDRQIIFHGNVTPALAGVVSSISSNTDNKIEFTSIASAPASGDTFYVIQTYTASSGTTTTVSLDSDTFVAKDIVGYRIRFVGNVTSALANVVADIKDNDSDSITFSTIASAPADGDIFYILPKVEYSRASYSDSLLILRRAININIPKNMKVELLQRKELVSLAQAQVKGVGWDIFQTDPRKIEILIPDNVRPSETNRSASYIHDQLIAVDATTLSSSASEGDTSITLADLTDWPMVGVVEINGSDRYGFSRKIVEDKYNETGSTRETINLVSGGLTSNSLVGQFVIISDEWSSVIESNTSSSLTLSNPIPDYLFNILINGSSTIKYVDPFTITLIDNDVPSGGYASGVTAELYQINYSGTDVINGNFRNIDDVFPGPYLFEPSLDAPTNINNSSRLDQNLAGPTKLVVSQTNTSTAFEVEDASFFPLSGFPYSASIGKSSGNSETIEITDVNLTQRVNTTLSVASSIGATFLEVVSLGSTISARFPNSKGYRVLIGRNTANEEVLWVTGVDGVSSPPRINIEAAIHNHAVGENIELLSDVVSVSSINSSHIGYITQPQKKTRWPSITSTQISSAENIRVLYSSINLTSTTGFDETEESVILNFGKELPKSSTEVSIIDHPYGSTIINVASSSLLPNSVFPYNIILGKGTYFEERISVVSNDTSLNIITLEYPTKFNHVIGEKVVFISGDQEIIEYSSADSGTLSFSSPIMLQSNHHKNESVISTEMKSIPQVNGFDFPFRMPPDITEQLQSLFDLVRAAGVQVTIIDSK